MKIIDEVYPLIKCETRLSDDGTLWIKSDNKSMEQITRVIIENTENSFCKTFYQDCADAIQGWNNHEVACMLAELFGDDCACNYNGIDEWLPLVCDLKDSCQNTVGVACWEQFLKHYGEAWGNNFNEQLSKSIKYEQTTPYKGGDAE